ncbi:tetratricopeptide repeat protein [Sphingomicrobium nitratireducens]|uniref:tetratricopeptide repeat protein n=1 Tax=Sphingomicrobium nitratireducens TaxID=2964666 RepID=UPI00223F38CF|nr:hypothetical protein [Sphingomicrobium nitratireducens]
MARLDGWKAIARHLNRDRATVMRWEASRGLPIHRMPGGGRASVFAFESELDAWLSGEGGDSALESDRGVGGIERRHVVTGLLALAAGAGTVGIVNFRRGKVEQQVNALLSQARTLLDQTTRDTQNQAIGLALEAVRIDEGNADAWGTLGYIRAASSRWHPEAESVQLREQAILDANRAFELDPGNAKAELAMAATLPLLGADNWLPRELGMRRSFARDPDDADALIEEAWIARMTGHCARAVELCGRVRAEDRTATLYNIRARALWSIGRPEESKRTFEKAALVYPNNKMHWYSSMEVAAFSGDIESASRIAADVRGLPGAVRGEDVETLMRVAKIVGGVEPSDAEAMYASLRARAPFEIRTARNAMRLAATIGRIDEAFEIANAYYFGRGFTVDGQLGSGLDVPQNQRHTNVVFEPPLAAMREDPRFERLVEEMGLARYWRHIGESPDFRNKV